MALNQSAAAEVRALIAAMEAERDELNAAITALRKVLARGNYDVSFTPEPESPASRPLPYQGWTMRQIVTKHLREHPGWKAGDVTRALKAEGYTRGGATRFSHRVYNEIWRMEKDGLVVKDETGGFRLKE